jgi:hypothetical protein
MRAKAMCLLLAAAAGCGGKKSGATMEPTPAGAPAEAAATTTTSQRFTGYAELDLEGGNPPSTVPEDVFRSVALAATAWAKGGATSGSVGVFQPDGASDIYKVALEAVRSKYSWRPIYKQDFGMICSAGGNRSMTNGTCSMKFVNNVLQLQSMRLRPDSAFVGLAVSKVPSGSRTIETMIYCVSLEYQGTGWVAKRGERVVSTRLCPRPSMP